VQSRGKLGRRGGRPEKVADALVLQRADGHVHPGRLGVTLRRAEVNGQPGAMFYGSGGLLTNVICLDITDGAVQAVRSVINPDKLHHLGPLSDFRSQLRGRPAGDA
jgi:hypothetical protein